MLVSAHPTNSLVWSALYWLNPSGIPPSNKQPVAVRQKASDGQWYITKGIAPTEKVVHGPYPSLEAAEMLIEMGAVEL